MKVLIEAQKNSNIRVRYNENTLTEESRHNLRKAYPYYYGFIIGSGSVKEDSLDCFIITEKEFKIGVIVECEPRDVFILYEGTETDIKILAIIENDVIVRNYKEVRDDIEIFYKEVFKEWPEIKIVIGPLLGERKAFEYIAKKVKD